MTITLHVPDLLARLITQDEPKEDRGLLIEAVCGLYARHRISSGEAADMLGVSRPEFWHELGRRKIPRQYTQQMLEEDLAFARRHG
jgi:predicted HTH domain antitoxin